MEITAVIEGLLWPYAPLNVRIGDLIVTDGDGYFIAYESFQLHASLMPVAGVLGGVVGMLSVSGTDRARLEGARQRCEERRAGVYGLSIEERIQDFPASGSFEAPKIDIGEGAVVLAETRKGDIISFPFAYKEKIYRKVYAPYTKMDPCGFYIDVLSPKALVRNLLLQNGLDEVATVKQGDAYAKSVLHQVLKTERKERQKFVDLKNHLSFVLKRELINVSKDYRSTTEGSTIYLVVLFGFVGLAFGAGGMIYGFSYGDWKAIAVGGLFFLFSLFFGVPMIRKQAGSRAFVGKLLKALERS